MSTRLRIILSVAAVTLVAAACEPGSSTRTRTYFEPRSHTPAPPPPLPTSTPTWTPSITQTGTITATPTISSTPTISGTATRTPTQSATATLTPTASPSLSATPALTSTPSASPTVTPTVSETPTHTASASVTVTATITASPSASTTATITATSSPMATATHTPTASHSATETAIPSITPTPTETPLFACGNGFLENLETCESCPADCVVRDCSATTPVVTFRVDFEFPQGGVNPTSATVLVGYRSDRVSLPGSGQNVSTVNARIKNLPSNTTRTTNDLDYALRLVASRALGLPSGRLFTIDFDSCAAAGVPTASDLGCTVEGCGSSTGSVPGCTCNVTTP